jgi:O-antigen/teichoic acid export membrane protein
MIFRSAKLILITDATILLSNVVSSLIGARALGPAGRGDLLIIVLWPPVVAMIAGMGLPTAYRYWMAKKPERVSALFSNAVIYTVVVGLISVGLAEMIVPHLIGSRSPEVFTLVRVYQISILAAIFLDFMRGLLEGTKRFGWAGAARLTFFSVQTVSFAGLWLTGRFTLTNAALTMIVAQTSATLLALFAVWRQFHPRWQPNWAEFKTAMHYGLRDYPGGLADYTTLRLDQLMLGAMASNVAIGLYIVAVRLSEATTLAADAIADALLPEVAGSKTSDKAEALWARSFRITFYLHAPVLVPLWFAAPLMMKLLFGERFVPATGAFRWLLVAAAVWSWGSIVISGLRGFGYPGLSTIARFSAAVVTAIALLILLPRFGIKGAAISSLIGYSVMLLIALLGLIKRRSLGFWYCLRPQWQDVAIPFWTLRNLAFARPANTSGQAINPPSR